MNPLDLDFIQQGAPHVSDGECDQRVRDQVFIDDERGAAGAVVDQALVAAHHSAVFEHVEAHIERVGCEGAGAQPGVDAVGFEAIAGAKVDDVVKP